MPPTLILIRHAEALHNATEQWHLPDPPLTDLGAQQCIELQANLKKHCPLAARTELIITSPLRRTVQTTFLALQWLVKSGVPVEVDAMWQENSDQPCDAGSDLAEMSEDFPELDFSSVDPIFPSKALGTPYAFTRTDVLARGEACLRKLYDRPEKVIAIVSHSGFLRTAISRCRYANADYRIFTFSKGLDGGPELREDRATERKGGGMGRSLKGLFPVEEWDFPLENIQEELSDEEHAA